jgi:MarR family transcriptional regulator, lower aerobic nicotinate degradation pathway regulator
VDRPARQSRRAPERPRRLGSIAELPIVNAPPMLSGALLEHLARRIRVAAASVLEALDLRPRHMVTLTLLRDFGEVGEVGQAELAERLRIDRTNLVGLLNELEEAGLIERRRSPEDRRRHAVTITTAGRHKLAQAEFAMMAVEGEVLGALDLPQRAELHDLLSAAVAGDALQPPNDGSC